MKCVQLTLELLAPIPVFLLNYQYIIAISLKPCYYKSFHQSNACIKRFTSLVIDVGIGRMGKYPNTSNIKFDIKFEHFLKTWDIIAWLHNIWKLCLTCSNQTLVVNTWLTSSYEKVAKYRNKLKHQIRKKQVTDHLYLQNWYHRWWFNLS